MAGGKLTILWDRDEAAVLNITSSNGGAATFTINGSLVTFPYSLTGDTTLETTKNEAYQVSVKLNNVEIAAVPDGVRTVNLLNGSELTFAPSPDDGFVSPSGPSGGGTPTADTAFLIATGSMDSDHTLRVLDLAWDDRFPHVDWIAVSSASATIADGALDCVVGLLGTCAVDFSATTAPDAPGTVGLVEQLLNGSDVLIDAGPSGTGDGQDQQTVTDSEAVTAGSRIDFAPGSVITIKGRVDASSDGETNDITDGVGSITIAIAITRGGSAPTLPS